MSQRFRLQRDNDVDLEFEGEQLSSVNSRDGVLTRWTTINIYKTTTNKYVVEVLGESSYPGEVTKRKVTVCPDAASVKKALRRKDEVSYLTHLALDALDVAGSRDPGIAAIIVERI